MTTAVDDDLWSAIGDPIRRRMLDILLERGRGTATTLSDELPVTRQAVAKHLAVLERAQLVHFSTAGRERLVRVDDVELARAATQLAEVGSGWDRRLGRIAVIAERIEQQRRVKPPPQEPDHTNIAETKEPK